MSVNGAKYDRLSDMTRNLFSNRENHHLMRRIGLVLSNLSFTVFLNRDNGHDDSFPALGVGKDIWHFFSYLGCDK